jgi:hypothetical protein
MAVGPYLRPQYGTELDLVKRDRKKADVELTLDKECNIPDRNGKKWVLFSSFSVP